MYQYLIGIHKGKLSTSHLNELMEFASNPPESLRSEKHYLYLNQLTELLSVPTLCNSVQTKYITD